MFDFDKLEVYKKAKSFNKGIYGYLKSSKAVDGIIRDQLRRASLSIMLNIAEGSSRFSKADRRNFMIISRGSVFECIAILDFFQDENLMDREKHQQFYADAEELSKMFFAMIRNLDSAGKAA